MMELGKCRFGEYRAIKTYDALGRPLTHEQRFKTSSAWASAFTTAQSYNLAGAITGQTYPSGHTTSYTYYDSTAGSQKPIGSLLTFSGNLGDGNSRTYADEILYNPQGQMIKEWRLACVRFRSKEAGRWTTARGCG